MKSFMKGFASLVPLEMIKIFDENELEVGKTNKLKTYCFYLSISNFQWNTLEKQTVFYTLIRDKHYRIDNTCIRCFMIYTENKRMKFAMLAQIGYYKLVCFIHVLIFYDWNVHVRLQYCSECYYYYHIVCMFISCFPFSAVDVWSTGYWCKWLEGTFCL